MFKKSNTCICVICNVEERFFVSRKAAQIEQFNSRFGLVFMNAAQEQQVS